MTTIDQSKRLEHLSPAKRAILMQKLRQETRRAEEGRAITGRPATDAPVLSFAQQRLWFLGQLEPNNPFYNIPIALRLDGQLRREALERSLTEALRRHEVLRMAFGAEEGRPVMRVAPATELRLAPEDLRDLPPEEQHATVARLCAQEAGTPFDLSNGMLLRTRLLRLADDAHVFLLTVHHIAWDGWSTGVFIQEVSALYRAFVAGEPPALPELPIQYADYAAWQRQWLQGEQLAVQLDYWRRQLAGAPPLLELPTDRPRPAVQSFRGARAPVRLPAALGQALKALARQEDATLFMILLAGFKTLLFRYSRQADLVVGTPLAGRSRPETRGLIGYFANTLALRATLDGDLSFRALLRRLRDIVLDTFAHQDLPFEKLVEELQPQRDLSRQPLFQVAFVLQNAPMPSLDLPGLTLSSLPMQSSAAKFDLTLELVETDDGIQGALEYSTDLFDTDTIARMVGHFQILLEHAVAQPERRIADLELLTPAERRELLEQYNTGRARFPADACVHELVARQAAHTPGATALVMPAAEGRPRQSLSYAELNARANQLAHELRRLGVGPETLVGICVERSVEMIVGMLGILKAGGAYVPLDPSYPADRLAFMLEDSRVTVVLTATTRRGEGERGRRGGEETHVLPLSPSPPLPLSPSVIDLDADWDRIAQQPTTNLESGVTPDSPAYVIYTSGSTGRPKGVVQLHGNVARLLSATDDWFGFNSDDIWTMFHSYAFDFSVWELWGALCSGGRVVLVPHAISRSPEEFYDLLAQERVTVLNQIPSAFQQLIRVEEQRGGAADLALRYVIFGGEALELRSLAPWFARHGDARPQLVNMYGITETTVHVTYRPVGRADLANTAPSLIGQAIPDMQLLVLDPATQQPQPIGVPGELYVGGAGLARGYLNRPELTAERFVPNPFLERGRGGEGERGRDSVSLSPPLPLSSSPLLPIGERLYKTGDLARYRPGGDIEYLGRIDAQVKVRGFRIELGEIEAALARHGEVRTALVAVREDTPGDRRLVAYIVPRALPGPSVGELRRHVRETLPDYMTPAAFVTLDELPLTPSGKIDRRALPAPGIVRPELDERFVGARTPAEQALAAIWREALGLAQVGVDDNFFALGGDSILSIRVLALAREQGLSISLQQMFQHQTIAELAGIAGGAAPEPPAPLAALALLAEADRARLPDEIEDAYPLARLQAGMLFHSAYSPESAVYHNITSAHVRAPFDAGQLRAALDQLAARHPVLRTAFDLQSYSEPLQLVYREASIPLIVEDLSGLPAEGQEAALDRWFEAEKADKFDWSRPPLLRFTVHRRSDASFQISLTEHHAILDGWSVASLMTELFQTYLGGLGAEAPAPRPAPAQAFRDFVAQERAVLADVAAREFWRGRLAGGSFASLPRWPAPFHQTGPRVVRALPAPIATEVSAGLRRLARDAAVSLKSVLLAAHARVLALLHGQDEVLTGLVANGRPEGADSEHILGLFLNTLPFRLALPGGSWADLARAAFAAEQELLPFRQYPLVELQKVWGNQPLFETAFNFTHFHVYQGLIGAEEAQVLEGRSFQETNFTLLANFSVDPASGQVLLTLDYNAGELAEAQIQAIAGYYSAALAQMAAEPDRPHRDASLLGEQELRRLAEWNDTATVYPEAAGATLHGLIAAQAARAPDAVAVVYEQHSLTYAALERRANQLAHALIARGVGPDCLVGICMERSVEMIIGLLGILKAGGAYVPIDPTYPAERLRFMLVDAQVKVLLTGREIGDWRLEIERDEQSPISNLQSPTLVYLDADWEQIAGQPATNPDSGVTPGHLAYTIYTSGSTGQPKGAMNSHAGIVNRLLWMQQQYALRSDDRVLQKTPFSFDVSVWEFFWPLLTGARLVFARPEGHRDSAYLADLIDAQQITTLHFVPSMLQVFLEEPELERRCRTLRRVICSGEALPAPLQERAFARLPGGLHNLYGPTEAAVDVTYWACEPGDGRPSVPIGRPIANTRAYVLDRALRPAPVGVHGELYLGGVQLARGYLNRPDLTAERFIPNPFSNERLEIGDWRLLSRRPISNLQSPISSRLYKTGDLARWLPDGTIEYLGRADFQVKLRGFRIELGEIEVALSRHPAVGAVAVLLREDTPGSPRLVAYIVPGDWRLEIGDDRRPNLQSLISNLPQELRSFLKERLPDYMIPAVFIFLDTLPLSPNGKLDRRALPAPDNARPELGAAYTPPASAEEQTLAEIWARALDLDRVGVEDNFFALGGDSIRSIQIIARARAQGLHFTLQQLFQHPTVRGLAAQLRPVEPAPTAPVASPFGLLSEADRARLQKLNPRGKHTKGGR